MGQSEMWCCTCCMGVEPMPFLAVANGARTSCGRLSDVTAVSVVTVRSDASDCGSGTCGSGHGVGRACKEEAGGGQRSRGQASDAAGGNVNVHANDGGDGSAESGVSKGNGSKCSTSVRPCVSRSGVQSSVPCWKVPHAEADVGADIDAGAASRCSGSTYSALHSTSILAATLRPPPATEAVAATEAGAGAVAVTGVGVGVEVEVGAGEAVIRALSLRNGHRLTPCARSTFEMVGRDTPSSCAATATG